MSTSSEDIEDDHRDQDQPYGYEGYEDDDDEVLPHLSLVNRRALNAQIKGENQRENLFHTRMLVGEKPISVIIDGGSCTNIVNAHLVKELGLITTKHPKPYNLGWFNNHDGIKVNKQCTVSLSLGRYEQDVLCDVVPMQACHVLLGRPWQFDNKVTHDGFTNRYTFICNSKSIKLVPLSPEEALND